MVDIEKLDNCLNCKYAHFTGNAFPRCNSDGEYELIVNRYIKCSEYEKEEGLH